MTREAKTIARVEVPGPTLHFVDGSAMPINETNRQTLHNLFGPRAKWPGTRIGLRTEIINVAGVLYPVIRIEKEQTR